jgi:hypothetical protein
VKGTRCQRCGGSGIDPEDSSPGSIWGDYPEPPALEPCRDCQFPLRVMCTCGSKNIGIAFVLDVDPGCPLHGVPCVVLLDGQGPSCDWDPDCPDCASRAASGG